MSKRASKVSKCADQKPCKGLSMFLDCDGGGLIARRIVNMKTMYGRDIYIVRKNARDVGVVLNFCPFCGTEINMNERYPERYKRVVEGHKKGRRA